MSYPAEYIRKGLNAADWLNSRRPSNYKPCRRRYYESYLSQMRKKVRYGTRELVLAPDGAFVLAHDLSHSLADCGFWLKEKKRFDVLASLEEAATAKNTPAFLRLLKAIEWNRKSAEEFIRAVDLALMAGAHLAARDLAEQGAEIHFDSEELQKYARILAPPQVSTVPVRSRINTRANAEWLKANRDRYKGNWVALRDGQLLDIAASNQELLVRIGETKGTGILVTNLY